MTSPGRSDFRRSMFSATRSLERISLRLRSVLQYLFLGIVVRTRADARRVLVDAAVQAGDVHAVDVLKDAAALLRQDSEPS